MDVLPRFLDDLLELVFPGICITCGNRLISQEKYLCMKCRYDLPVNNFHLNPDNNKVARLFWGRVRIESAASFFHYRQGSIYQKLIHYVKYKGLKELGFETGKWFGDVLRESFSFATIDFIVPVPLHPRKKKKRGYNQSEWIAYGLGESMNKKVVPDNLFRKLHTTTQTRKNRFERWQNVEGIFGIRDMDIFTGRHILLVDDVVTTGSTLEACAIQVLRAKDSSVSVATLAFAET